ncbi:MAG: site-specific DNA-methyltransferase [Candidatus Methanomethylophilaceae archaeon]|nr:site-specific DNA-methyltransferase [Candidatus Methanomethylophilaceae archaeon]
MVLNERRRQEMMDSINPPRNKILCGDCMVGLKEIPDGCVDLIMMDPPYLLDTSNGHGGRGFGPAKGSVKGSANYMKELHQGTFTEGITDDVLDELVRVMRKINIYIWCNERQIPQYLNYFLDKGCNFNVLTWHKSRVIPFCANMYLSDTEYCLFFRDKGVRIRGDYSTLSKYHISIPNVEDKNKYDHPTIKPLQLIRRLISNSSDEGDLVLDPFMGSGTTAVACVQSGRDYLGWELDEGYHKTAERRVDSAHKSTDLLSFFE